MSPKKKKAPRAAPRPQAAQAGKQGKALAAASPPFLTPPLSGDPILRTVSRAAFALIKIFALLLLWRGHNAPGGGFIAGLMTVCALILHRMSTGTDALRRIDPISLVPVGTALSFIRCDDPSLVAQVLGSPVAESAALRSVAPTVLVSQARPLDLVEALRADVVGGGADLDVAAALHGYADGPGAADAQAPMPTAEPEGAAVELLAASGYQNVVRNEGDNEWNPISRRFRNKEKEVTSPYPFLDVASDLVAQLAVAS